MARYAKKTKVEQPVVETPTPDTSIKEVKNTVEEKPQVETVVEEVKASNVKKAKTKKQNSKKNVQSLSDFLF